MLFISYNYYKGGSKFEISDLPTILTFFVGPLAIAGAIAIVIYAIRKVDKEKAFFWSAACLSIAGGFTNSFAAYLAWWSTTN